jgi:predicted negative regulator of RcsB-dependent stress response
MPPAKRRPTQRPDDRLLKATGLNKRLRLIHAAIASLRRSRALVRRDEFAEVQKSLRQLRANTDDILKHTKDLATQFTRIAQIQAELDVIKSALKKAK